MCIIITSGLRLENLSRGCVLGIPLIACQERISVGEHNFYWTTSFYLVLYSYSSRPFLCALGLDYGICTFCSVGDGCCEHC